jgi:hypothetical protein
MGIETRTGAEVAGQLQYAAKLLNVSRLPVPPIPSTARRLLKLEVLRRMELLPVSLCDERAYSST